MIEMDDLREILREGRDVHVVEVALSRTAREQERHRVAAKVIFVDDVAWSFHVEMEANVTHLHSHAYPSFGRDRDEHDISQVASGVHGRVRGRWG